MNDINQGSLTSKHDQRNTAVLLMQRLTAHVTELRRQCYYGVLMSYATQVVTYF